MGKIALEIKAHLENVSELKTIGEDFRWYLKLKCTSCGEVSSTWQYVCLSENVETKGGRGHASMVQKCKMCGRENHLDIIKDQIKSYQINNDGEFSTIVMFECRGLEPIEWDIRSGWVVFSSCSSTQFGDVDLSENEWYDYDENANQSIGITEIQYNFIKGIGLVSPDIQIIAVCINMSYEELGKAFVSHYYTTISTDRSKLFGLYNESSIMTFEGKPCKGQEEIGKKIMALTFKTIQHNITSLDCQPIIGVDGNEAVSVTVMGQLKTDEDPPHSFVQTFLLRKPAGQFFIANETFRMILHD